MSIPRRLWRIVRGRIATARRSTVDPSTHAERRCELERLRELAVEAEAAAQAARELAEATRRGDGSEGARERGSDGTGFVPSTPRAIAPSPTDAFAAEYALLQLAPEAATLAALEAAYQARLEEHRPRSSDSSTERAQVEARRRAIQEAYERLRDALNPTETRFERLEF